jgi:hypothetical protein
METSSLKNNSTLQTFSLLTKPMDFKSIVV